MEKLVIAMSIPSVALKNQANGQRIAHACGFYSLYLTIQLGGD